MKKTKTALYHLVIIPVVVLAVILTLRATPKADYTPMEVVKEVAVPVGVIVTYPVEVVKREYIELPAEEYHDLAAEYIAKTLYGECRNCTKTEQAAVAWTILNRVDSEDPYFPDDIIGVVTQFEQYHGYSESNPVLPELLALTQDVLLRWELEKMGVGDVGRVLPVDWLWFYGDGIHNYFQNEYEGAALWDWSMPSPYEEEQS